MIKTIITYQGSMDSKVKGFSPRLKEVLQDAVKVWHGSYSGGSQHPPSMLAGHFVNQAQAQRMWPEVQPRTPSYMKQKARKYGHQRNLEFTGTTKTQVTRSISISGTSKKAAGRMTGANRALNFSSGKRVDLRKELLAINQEEAQQLAEFVNQEMAAFLNSNEPRETKNV